MQTVPPALGAACVGLLQSALLQHVRHGFTSRHGGTSQGPGASLDLKLGELAGRAAVRDNRRRVLAALACSSRRFVTVTQMHADAVVELTAQASPHIEADGIWTRDADVVLAILSADCVPVLMADSKGRAVAAVHAGWRGTKSRVVTRMVERLQAAAGIFPHELRAVMGPAIGPCCFHIGHDTATQLRQAYPSCTQAIGPRRAHKTTADLWGLNRQALIEAGLEPTSIASMQICTACTNDYFSYRRDKGATGRQAGVIALY